MRFLVFFLYISCFCCVFNKAALAVDVAKAAQDFGRLPHLSAPKVSPDGKYLATLTPVKGRHALIVMELETLKLISVLSLDSEALGNVVEVGWYRWASNDRLLVSVYAPTKRGANRVPTIDSRLISLDVQSQNMKLLLRQSRSQVQAQSKDDVISYLPNDPDHILMAFAPEGGEPAVYKVNIHTDKKKRISGNVMDIWEWYADWEGNVRIGFGFVGRNKIKIVAKTTPDSGRFKQLIRANSYEESTYSILAFADETRVYVSSTHGTGRRGIYILNLETEEFEETVFQHEEVDLGGILFTPTGKALAISYTTDHHHYYILDEEFGRKYRGLKGVFPDQDIVVSNVSNNARYWMIYAYQGHIPGSYYLFDSETNELSPIGHAYAQLKDYELSPVEAISYRARDGVKINGYLTLPAGEKREGLPFVILPHGGPHLRDTNHFDYWVQYLAHLGVGVIQPNFRGSSGYGAAFKAAGYGEWGRAMQDDVTDATQWVIDQGFADPDRICIAGGSYGGYAALMGVIQHPDLYRCAISLNGVTDMPRLVKDQKKYVGGTYHLQAIKPSDDDTSLRDISPRHNADKISDPVLIVQGDIDRAVIAYHGSRMQKSLKKAKVEHKFIEQDDGDHSLSYQPNRMEFLEEMGLFLTEHLGL